MPIVEVDVVCQSEAEFGRFSAAALASSLGRVFGSPPGTTWVKLRQLAEGNYAENESTPGAFSVWFGLISTPSSRALDRRQSWQRASLRSHPASRRLQSPVFAINASGTSADRASLLAHGIRVLEMANVGHFPMLEQPDEFNVLLIRAIDQLRQPNSKK